MHTHALKDVAPAFVAMAHSIVWCAVATIDSRNRPWTRVLHPLWEWDGERLVGWIGTSPTKLKRAHLAHSAFVSCHYWSPDHDTCSAECAAEWCLDVPTRVAVWEKFKNAPPPVGVDFTVIPRWAQGPTVDEFAVIRLEPWRVRVFPGTAFFTGDPVEPAIVWDAIERV
jgi:hypothetical protein